MARVKKTTRAPPGYNRGLAGVPQLDPTHAQPNHNQNNLQQLSQSFWEAPNPPDSEFVRMRDAYQMPPPPPPAVSEQEFMNEVLAGDYDTELELSASARADTSTPLRKKRKIAHGFTPDAGLEKNFVAGLQARKRTPSPLSRSLTDCRIRISALQSSLLILQDKKKELKAMKNRAPHFGDGRVVDEPETKDSSRHVTFVNYDAEHVRKRLETSKKELGVAKEEGDLEEKKRLAGTGQSGFQRAIAELMKEVNERNTASERGGDLPMSGMEG
ncbi:hypothetical protein GJ744_001481 [Endocarpon pusillum]|uniref:Uncharacterized protein n=1 Tax=Endocarpon pusillum TaxID=364733 RepID=A0A8H7ADD5_9EURO|nr:hypothetical protein GJ744_001481 [Endocarpon pusillum]